MYSKRRLLLAVVACGLALTACSSSNSALASSSRLWESKLLKTCSGKANTNSTLSIQSKATISGANIAFTRSCLLEIDGGSLTIDSSNLKVATLGVVLGANSNLIIKSSEITGLNPSASLSVSSSGAGQTVQLANDKINIFRGILVEVGLGYPPTKGVHDFSVTNSKIVASSPSGVGIELISRGKSKFSNDVMSTAANGGVPEIETSSPSSCRIYKVKGFHSTRCTKLAVSPGG